MQTVSLSVSDLRAAQAQGSQIVDVRVPVAYNRAHIPGSINVPYTRQGFVQQAAFFLRREAPILLVADNAPLAEFATQELSAAGFNVQGVLEGGVAVWQQSGGEIASLGQITADELKKTMTAGDAPLLVDVREAWEYNSGHIEGAVHLPLSQFTRRYTELKPDAQMVFVCASGARSGEAVQFLYRLGYQKVFNLVGGMNAWLAGGRRA